MSRLARTSLIFKRHGKTTIFGAKINGATQTPATLDVLVASTPSTDTLLLPAVTAIGTASPAVQMTINGAGIGQTIIDCAGIVPVGSKAVFVPQVAGTVISNMTIRNAAIPNGAGGNAAGVRDNGTGSGFTLTNVEITGCQNGVLTTSDVVFSGCNFHGNGNGNPGGGNTHEIYLTVGVANASLTNQTSTCGPLATHALKSRSLSTTVTGGTFTGNSDDGTNGGSVIDIPDGGAVNISGATLVTTGVSNNVFLGYRSESSANISSGHIVTLTNVHLTDNTGTGGAIINYSNVGTASVLAIGSGCVYDGPTAPTLTGWGTVTGAFAPASVGLNVVLGVFNAGAATVSVPSEFSTTHPIAVGDLPSGGKLVCTGPGGAVVIQQDRSFRPWAQDGSGRGSVISMVLPDTFTSGQTRNYTLTQTAGSPNNTPFITLAQLASGATINSVAFPATDFKLKFYGGDLGGTDVFHVQANDIATNGTAFPWGSNPKQGWTVIKAGSVVCEWCLEGFLKRDSDGNFHRWKKAKIWVRVWNTGKYEVAALVCQPNCTGPVTGATVGNATVPVKVSCFAELYNGATLIKAFGGPNDTRTYTFANTAVNTGAGTFSLTAPQAATWGRPPYGGADSDAHFGLGAIFTTTSSLPGGILPNTVYWPTQAASGTVGTAFVVGADRPTAMWPNTGNSFAAGGFTPVTLSSQGVGTHTITPVATTFQECGWMALDSTAQPFWIGSGSKPQLLPVHDRTYLTRNAKAMPYYDWTSTQYPLQTTPLTHQPGVAIWTTNMESSGDGPGDERINPLGCHSAIMAMYNQTDPGWIQSCRVLAAGWVDFPIFFIDETSGQPIVTNQGPNRAGGNYTNLGATNSTFKGGPSPQGGGVTLSASAADSPGYYSPQTPDDAAHQPAPWIVPYLRSGDDWWIECGKMHVTGMIACTYSPTRNQSLSGTAYGGIIDDCTANQVRTCAWATRSLMALDYFMANSDPIRAMITDCADDNAAFLPAWGAAQSASMKSFGAYGVGGSTGATMPLTMSGYMTSFCDVIYGLEALRGERSGWLTFYNNYFRFLSVEPFNSDNGGLASEYWIGLYWWNMYVGVSGLGTTFYSSLSAFLSGNLGSAIPGGSGFAPNGTPAGVSSWISFEPLTGGTSGWGAPMDCTDYPQAKRAGLATWAAAGGTHAETVLGRVNTRIAALGGVIFSEAGSVNGQPALTGYPDWNILAS